MIWMCKKAIIMIGDPDGEGGNVAKANTLSYHYDNFLYSPFVTVLTLRASF